MKLTRYYLPFTFFYLYYLFRYEGGKGFSVVGLLRCAVYFRQRDHASRIILNRNWRAIAANGKLKDGDELGKLESAGAGILEYTPIGVDEKE